MTESVTDLGLHGKHCQCQHNHLSIKHMHRPRYESCPSVRPSILYRANKHTDNRQTDTNYYCYTSDRNVRLWLVQISSPVNTSITWSRYWLIEVLTGQNGLS